MLTAALLLQPAKATAQEALDGVAQSLGVESDALLSSHKLLPGDSVSDWIALVSGRCGGSGDSYLQKLQQHVTSAYAEESRLDRAKATEWHRISLTALALGGDPTAFGRDSKGSPINLIADGTYNWNMTDTLGTQGLNAWIFSLITLDAKAYAVPEDAVYTRSTILQTLLESQESDGGFGLNRGSSNLDISAMALQALAPYRNSTAVYHLASGEDTTVKQTVTRALDYLKTHQLEDGTFGNSCSTAQVVVALCSLGIDPGSFAAQGVSAKEGLLAYEAENGLFRYQLEDESYDLMSTEQVILALVSMERLNNHQRRIFDYRQEMDSALQQQIAALNEEIAALEPAQLTQQAEALYDRYQQIPAEERSYVSSYWILEKAMEQAGISPQADDPALAYNITSPTEVKNAPNLWWIAVAILAAGAITVTVVLLIRKGKQKHV